MRARLGAIAWFVTGALVGFGGLALILASLGVVALLPAAAIGALLLAFRVRSDSMFFIGAGLGITVPWGLHITSGDTPDDQLSPVVFGLVLVAAGIFLRPRHSESETRSSQTSA